MDISQIPFYFSEYIMHFDKYIPVVMASYGSLIYFILFMIIFCETGLVVTPFLPGDSLLFACGALSATANSLHFGTLFAICLAAAIEARPQSYFPLPLRTDCPYLRPLCGRYRHHALQHVPPL